MNILLFNEHKIENSGIVKVTGRQFTHASKIIGIKTGGIIKAGMINGKIGKGEIVECSTNFFKFKFKPEADPPEPLNLKLILALPRPKSLKRIIQHATALGVKEIYIIKTWRVEKGYWQNPLLKEENLYEELILGLEQAVDTILPKITIKKLFKPFIEDEISEIILDSEAYIFHPGGKLIPSDTKKPVTIAIGPEGGFIEYEVEKFVNAGFTLSTFGKRILRTETAVPAAIARLKGSGLF